MNYKNAIKDIDGQIKRLEEARRVLVGLSGGAGTRVRGRCQRLGDDGLPRLSASGGRRFERRSKCGRQASDSSKRPSSAVRGS